MCLMDVNNAALALVDEDQEEEVIEFLDWLSDFYVEYIRRCAKIGRIDSVMLHDDWGTQKGPFFSLETARKYFVPPMKKIVDACHELDIIFEHHCCGKADMLIEKYKDEHLTFAVSSPILPIGSTPEQVRQIAKDFVDKYKDKGVLFCQDVSLADRCPEHDPSLYPIFADAVYEFGRIAYQDVEE